MVLTAPLKEQTKYREELEEIKQIMGQLIREDPRKEEPRSPFHY